MVKTAPHVKKILEYADSRTKITLSNTQFLQPPRIFIKIPRNGLMKDREFLQGLIFLDFCQCSPFDNKKPTCIWGMVEGFPNRLWPGFWCKFTIPRSKRHFHRFGGNIFGGTSHKKYRVPDLVIFQIDGKEERHIPKGEGLLLVPQGTPSRMTHHESEFGIGINPRCWETVVPADNFLVEKEEGRVDAHFEPPQFPQAEKSELFQFSSAPLGKEKKKWVERSTNEFFESAHFTQGTESEIFVGQVYTPQGILGSEEQVLEWQGGENFTNLDLLLKSQRWPGFSAHFIYLKVLEILVLRDGPGGQGLM